MAKQQATEAYQRLLDRDAAPQHVAIARSELAFLRSEQGPLFQADLLEDCGYAQITPALNPDQSPLDIVREIAAAIMVGLNQQPVAQLEQLMRRARAAEPSSGRITASGAACVRVPQRHRQRKSEGSAICLVAALC